MKDEALERGREGKKKRGQQRLPLLKRRTERKKPAFIIYYKDGSVLLIDGFKTQVNILCLHPEKMKMEEMDRS